MPPVLAAKGLRAGYGGVLAVRDVDLMVDPGEVVLLMGPNGAGKTTTMLSLSGDLPLAGGEVAFLGQPVRDPLHERARRGLGLVTEERSIFTQMSVTDNLRVARVDPARVLELFPELESRLPVKAGLLSGGEQKMLALGCMLARDPRVLLLDELSLGLAPLVVTRLLATVRGAADSGVGVLLIEQHLSQALKYADRVYLMRRGEIQVSGTAAAIADRLDEIEAAYISGAPLGSEAGR